MTVEDLAQSGPLGTPITVDVKGIGWRPLFNSLGPALRQQLHRLDVGGDDRRLGEVHDSGDRPRRRCTSSRCCTASSRFPYRNMQQNPGARPAALGDPVHGHGGPAVLPPPPETQAQTVIRGLPPPGELVSTPAFSGVDEPVIGERRRASSRARPTRSTGRASSATA